MYSAFFAVAFIIVIMMSMENIRMKHAPDSAFKTFQRDYLIVYSLAYFADWLKGPYVYVLYESYGLTDQDIALLFVVGFGSSAVSGPFVGTLADKFGRKKMCLAYFIVYILCAFTKMHEEFKWLLLGRVLGGIGTSLLCTSFESWMVTEHNRFQFGQELLNDTFVKSSMCNSGSAIIAGLVAQCLSDRYGYLAPFLFGIVPLTLGLIVSCFRWSADQPKSNTSFMRGFQESLASMDKNLWVLGLSQSMFLGTMYTFVFLWTPAMDIAHEGHDLPYGLLFSIFMLMISIGSNIFKKAELELEKCPFIILTASTLCFAGMAVYIQDEFQLFVAFILFEAVCGVMFPVYGSLRSMYVPEATRTTVLNIYRVPLNVYVVIMLLNKRNMSIPLTFGICCATNAVALALWWSFIPTTKTSDGETYTKCDVVERRTDEEEDFGSLEQMEEDF